MDNNSTSMTELQDLKEYPLTTSEFIAYCKCAVQLVSEFPGTCPDTIIFKERYFLSFNGNIFINIYSESNKLLGQLKLDRVTLN